MVKAKQSMGVNFLGVMMMIMMVMVTVTVIVL